MVGVDSTNVWGAGPMGEIADNGTGQGLGSRVEAVVRNIRSGGGLVGAAVTIGLFTKEVQRILGLPPMMRNDLYLVLLVLVFLLVGSWFLCALTHVEQMQKLTDPSTISRPKRLGATSTAQIQRPPSSAVSFTPDSKRRDYLLPASSAGAVSSTSRTFCARTPAVKGFSRNARPPRERP